MSKKDSARAKADAVQHWVPQDREQVNRAIEDIGRLQRDRQRIEAAMNDELAKVRAKYEDRAKPLGVQIGELVKGIAMWCATNRATLTKDGRVKTHTFAAGLVKWRLAPWSVGLRGVEEVLKLMKASDKLKSYIRTKEEVNKEQLLQDRERLEPIRGVTFRQREEFIVLPHASKIEEVQ